VPKLIFDTSAVNALAIAPEIEAIIKGIGLSYTVAITETVFAEIVATPEEEKRRKLLGVLDRLLHPGYCVMPYQWIIEHQAKAFEGDRTEYDWRQLNVRFVEGEEEIARQEVVHAISEETKVSNRQLEDAFTALFANARPAFQKIFENGAERPTLRAATEHLMGDRGAYLSIAAGLVERATGNRPDEPTVKEFIDRCDPFKALLVALCFAQYDRCIREDNVESLGRTGRNDMYSAVYLPYCRVFVTNDDGQQKALGSVAELMGLGVDVLMYVDFKNRLFGLGAVTG
jgi:hypothetical protein